MFPDVLFNVAQTSKEEAEAGVEAEVAKKEKKQQRIDGEDVNDNVSIKASQVNGKLKAKTPMIKFKTEEDMASTDNNTTKEKRSGSILVQLVVECNYRQHITLVNGEQCKCHDLQTQYNGQNCVVQLTCGHHISLQGQKQEFRRQIFLKEKRQKERDEHQRECGSGISVACNCRTGQSWNQWKLEHFSGRNE